MATQRLLVNAGYLTYAGAIDDWELQELERLKTELNTNQIIPVMLDIRKSEEIDSVITKVENENPNLAAIIVNGAACPHGTPFELTDLNSARDVFETNYFGNLNLMLRALVLMKKNKSRVIWVSSMWGLIPAVNAMPYSSSKHAGEVLFATMRRELEPFGIKIVITNPGGVKHTYMVAEHFHGSKEYLADMRGCSPEEVSKEERDRGKNSKLIQPNIKKDKIYEPHYQAYMEATRDVSSDDKFKICATAHDCAVDVMKGLQSSSPRLRYLSGWDCKFTYFFKRILPERWLDWIFIKALMPNIKL